VGVHLTSERLKEHGATPEPSVPMLGIVGWSGAGKTSLLEYLLPRLAAQGVRTAVIRHGHPAVHKDSCRLKASGAIQVLVASREKAEMSLSELAARLPPCDLVLIEGFKREPIPKLEIYRHEVDGAPCYPHDPHVVAVAADGPVSGLPGSGLIWLDVRQPAQVLAWLQIRVGSHNARAAA
jgi:molybdopterin-guanine dinucleotide biosynthesis adapter protein